MRQLITLFIIGLFALSMVIGCGQKAEQDTDKMPAEDKAAEMADTTQMDSANMMDTLESMVDSMADEAKEAVEDAADEAKDAMGGN